jgi:predicted phosphodiesterase
VTDLHLDPVGAELARSIVRSYEASLVIDTGDLPILGADVEGRVYESLVDTSVPRIYVPGNHDSPASETTLGRLGYTVLTSGTAEVDGVRVLGVPDPISRTFGVEPDPGRLENAGRAAYARLRRALRSGEATPDIVAIHNPVMEEPFVGVVPLILSGHTHSARLYVSDGTVRLNSGTLGGMPYDPETSGREVLPYSASVLYFTAEEPRRLIAVDRIAVFPTRSSTISRDVIDESLLP